MKIQTREFLAFAKTLEGKTLFTLARRVPFSVEVSPEGLHFTPHSTMARRFHSIDYVDRVHSRFEKTDSFRPADYKFTVEASYHLAILKLFISNQQGN